MQGRREVKTTPLPDAAISLSNNLSKGSADGVRGAGEGQRRRLGLLAVFICLILTVVLLQGLGSAYSCEFSGPDEAAHLLTGLMIRDYIASGFPGAPIPYAEKYYAHYPKVAFAMWGPLLHFTEAGWLLVFPSTRASLLLLMAAITAGTAFLIYLTLAREFGPIPGLTSALLFVAVPTVQRYSGMIMADGCVALLDFCAALALGRYLNTRKPKHVLLFAGFACLGILTKGNAVALVLLPGFAILLTRAFGVLKRPSFWAAAAIIVGIAGPWQYYSAQALIGIAERRPGWTFILPFGRLMAGFFGAALLPVIAIGLYERVIVPAWKRKLDGQWAAAAALILSVWSFHCLVPGTGPEVRYLIAVIPPLLMFLAAGMRTMVRWLTALRFPSPAAQALVAAGVACIFLATEFSIPRKPYYGFEQVARLVAKPEYKDAVVLVSSTAANGNGEGMLISEVAMREKRPSHIILRATKMLSQSDWLGGHYRLVYRTPAEVLKFLKSIPVGIVVIDHQSNSAGNPDHQLLVQTLAEFPNEWERLETYAGVRSTIDVYYLKSATGRARSKIVIDLPYTLKRPIEF